MTRAIVFFMVITYGLSIGLASLVGFTGAERSPWAGLGITAMLFPAVAVLFLRLTMKERLGPLGAMRFPVRYALIALLLIPFTMHAAMLPPSSSWRGAAPLTRCSSPREEQPCLRSEVPWCGVAFLQPFQMACKLS